MKYYVFTLSLLLLTSSFLEAQNPYSYETAVEIISSKRFMLGNEESNLDQIQILSNQYNSKGYKMIQLTTVNDIGGVTKIVIVFERSSSYREAELYKLINELTTRIDNTSKKYTDSAMVTIQTNVLNYLKSIPNDVITKEYKEQLTKIILSEAEDKIKKVVEELKKEIRNETNHN